MFDLAQLLTYEGQIAYYKKALSTAFNNLWHAGLTSVVSSYLLDTNVVTFEIAGVLEGHNT